MGDSRADYTAKAAAARKSGPEIVEPCFIDETAQVDPSAKIGPNVSIGAGVKIGFGVRVKDAIVLDNTVLEVSYCPMEDGCSLEVACAGWAKRSREVQAGGRLRPSADLRSRPHRKTRPSFTPSSPRTASSVPGLASRAHRSPPQLTRTRASASSVRLQPLARH